MNVLRNVLVVVAALSLAGAVQAAAAKQQQKANKAPKAPAALVGVIVSVDGAKLTVKTGNAKQGSAKQVVVETTDKTVVTIDGETAKVEQLKKGMRVKVTPQTGAAQRIEALTPTSKPKPAPNAEKPAKNAEKPAKNAEKPARQK